MTKLKSSIARALSRRPVAAGRAAHGERLDLILPSGWPDSGVPLVWRWQRRGGAAEAGECQELDRLPEAARRVPTHVWTPAADTMLTRVTLPTRSARKIMQALPYALEDRLLGDPDSLHFAWRPEADGTLSVAVTSRLRLRTWTERLGKAGVRPQSLCPATLLVPWALDSWSLAFVGAEALVRTGAVSGFVCQATGELPPALLVAAAQEAAQGASPPESLVVFHPPAGFSAPRWSELLGIAVRGESGSVWDRLADGAAPINLLQGQFEQGSSLGETLRPYRLALGLFALWLAGTLAFDVSDWWTLRREHDALRQEMTGILKSSFPETRVVLDPVAQMKKAVEQQLARRGQGERELLPMLAKVATVLRGDPRARLRGLRYADHALTLEITWTAPATPDAWKSALDAGGLRTEVLSLTPRANEVDGRLRLTAGTPPRSGT